MDDHIKVVDDHLASWSEFARGNNDEVANIRESADRFQVALSALLEAKDKRAPARAVFYTVVQVGGAIPTWSTIGHWLGEILGPDFPVVKGSDGEGMYFAGDLYFWWLSAGDEWESFPMLEEWLSSDFAKNVAIPLYESARSSRDE